MYSAGALVRSRPGKMVVCRACREDKHASEYYWISRRRGKRNAFLYERCRDCLSRFTKDELYIRDRGVCGICGNRVPYSQASVDHRIPLSRGGEHADYNVQLAHRRCNSLKGDHIPGDAEA